MLQSYLRVDLARAFCACAVIGLLVAAFSSRAESGSQFALASVDMTEMTAFPKSDIDEPSLTELDRIRGRFSREDSSRWLRALRPGVEILWITKNIAGVRISVTTSAAGDSVEVGIGQVEPPDTPLRRLPTRFADSERRTEVLWDLCDSNGKRIKPGLYYMSLTVTSATRLITKEVFVAQEPTHPKDAWRFRY